MGRTIHTAFERQDVLEVNFTSQDFTTEVMVTSRPPGTFEIASVTFTNSSPNLTVADPKELERLDIHPGMLLFEDEDADGTGLTASYVVGSVNPDHATNHIVLTSNWSGTGADLTAYLKRPNETWRWVLQGWEVFSDVAQTITFTEKEADAGGGGDNEMFQTFVAANGGVSTLFPRKMTAGTVLAITSSAGTDTSMNLKLEAERA